MQTRQSPPSTPPRLDQYDSDDWFDASQSDGDSCPSSPITAVTFERDRLHAVPLSHSSTSAPDCLFFQWLYVAVITWRGIETTLDNLWGDLKDRTDQVLCFLAYPLAAELYRAIRHAEQEHHFSQPRTSTVLFVPDQQPIRPNMAFQYEHFCSVSLLLQQRMQQDSVFPVCVEWALPDTAINRGTY